MRNGPHTEEEDHQSNPQETSKNNGCGLKIEPILCNRPEQDGAYQKGQDTRKYWRDSFFTVHLIALFHSRIMAPFINLRFQRKPQTRGDHDEEYDSGKRCKDLDLRQVQLLMHDPLEQRVVLWCEPMEAEGGNIINGFRPITTPMTGKLNISASIAGG